MALDGGKAFYDLTTLAGERSISRTRVTPPTNMYEEMRFDLCADLSRKEGVAEGDQVRHVIYCIFRQADVIITRYKMISNPNDSVNRVVERV